MITCRTPAGLMPAFAAVLVFTSAFASALRAELVANPATLDLGRHRQEQTVSSKVILTNHGKEPVEIGQIAADCSCTAATPAKTTLQPGESTDLAVSFETRTYQGEVRRRVLVRSTEGDLIIPVQAVVSPWDDWVFSVPMAILPSSNRGQPTETTFQLEYVGKGAVQVETLSSRAAWLKAEIVEHSGNTWKIRVAKEANAPGGNHQPRLTIHTSDAHEPEIGLGVFASVYSTLDLRPNPLVLPAGKVGEAVTMPFSIAGWEEKADPRWEIEGGKVTQQNRDGRDVLLSLEVTPTKPGTSTRLLRLYSGEDVEMEVPVILRAD